MDLSTWAVLISKLLALGAFTIFFVYWLFWMHDLGKWLGNTIARFAAKLFKGRVL